MGEKRISIKGSDQVRMTLFMTSTEMGGPSRSLQSKFAGNIEIQHFHTKSHRERFFVGESPTEDFCKIEKSVSRGDFGPIEVHEQSL
jgi:hypothetical protein